MYLNAAMTKQVTWGGPVLGVGTGNPSSTRQVPREQRGPHALHLSPLQSESQLTALTV